MAVAQSIYAKALFEAAKEKGSLPQVRADLADFVEAVEASPELRNLLLNPRIDVRAKQAGLDAVFGDAEPAVRELPEAACAEGTARRDRRDPPCVRAARRRGGEDPERRAHHGARPQRGRGRRDHREDRAGIRAQGRCDALGRSLPHRRHGPPGRIVPRRRERPRSAHLSPSRTGNKELIRSETTP